MNALEVTNLTKVYPKFTLDKVSFCVKEGHIAGLIGRNGAGKSTTLKGILGLISTIGDVRVFDKAVSTEEQAVKQMIGYVGGGFRYYPTKTLATIGKVVSTFYSDWDRKEYEQYLNEFSLEPTKKVHELSEGMKVKFSVALAMSHNAKLLIMDEPTSGLDPLSREEFCDIILSLVRERGVTVLFSTHITSDLERIADDIIYISDGKILIDEPLKDVLSKYSLAHFADIEQARAANAIGVKLVKDGYEGLVPKGTEPIGATISEATLDHIMIHFESAKKGGIC